jgi:hypothetical protein
MTVPTYPHDAFMDFFDDDDDDDDDWDDEDWDDDDDDGIWQTRSIRRGYRGRGARS